MKTKFQTDFIIELKIFLFALAKFIAFLVVNLTPFKCDLFVKYNLPFKMSTEVGG